MKFKLEIDGMGCDHCVNSVKNALSAVSGVNSVSAEIGSAEIETDDSVKEADLREALDDAGYELKGVTLL
ncbi:heavy-metal-associated domain-containing protein [Anaeropeptidivorans aminofermentans]|jgi:copper chaperone CopZ|uniref:heavy-metal-associated domain-containing protein n=1 Tax=Anaeropeptidivorans aminofermentans TaxID=2934315 RepID=UPI002024EA41|nr:cation transporter [Anaeropeptidivorans aminofermentans]MBE6012300.1 copper chaperone [Lachnospiraceae bacterium]